MRFVQQKYINISAFVELLIIWGFRRVQRRIATGIESPRRRNLSQGDYFKLLKIQNIKVMVRIAMLSDIQIYV